MKMANELTPAETHEANVEGVQVDTTAAPALIVAKEGGDDTGSAPTGTSDGNEASQSDATTETAPKKPEKVPEWMQKKMNDMEAERRLAKKEAKEAKEALAARDAVKPPAATEPEKPAAGQTQAEFDAAVRAEARRQADSNSAAAKRADFDTKANKTVDAGKEAFGADFDTAVANLFAVGALPLADEAGNVRNDEILALVLETENPAKVLFELGSDPAKAAELVNMSSAKRAIEIAKLSVTVPAAKAPTPLSKAPRPVQPVNGGAQTSNAPSDNDDDDTFFAKREAELKAGGKW